MSDERGDGEPFKTRLVRAVVETVREGDPPPTIAIGPNELWIRWEEQ